MRKRGIAEDHPRGCGEHGYADLDSLDDLGSSPRMRGALRTKYVGLVKTRIIPADAGSTQKQSSVSPSSQDHPRGCGEHIAPLGYMIDRRGSSPRMRGAPGSSSSMAWARRIIPADAGSTAWLCAGFYASADHPRGCGEHLSKELYDWIANGSSPRMRGARCPCLWHFYSPGIIPADAGSTILIKSWLHETGDHPRGCGEHWDGQTPSPHPGGSSPRMRGARRLAGPVIDCVGIIPADAGSTCSC